MGNETTKGAAILGGGDRAKAGARCIVKRSMRKVARANGVPVPAAITRYTPAELAAWALANPLPVLAACVAAMERAADHWIRGNNSGNSDAHAEGCRQCDWLREDATVVLALWEIVVDFPGLFPTYSRAGYAEEYDGRTIGRLVEAKNTPRAETNFAENQQRWDRGEVSPAACYRKGQEHRAYGWSSCLGFEATPEQQAAYRAGCNGEAKP